MPRKYFIIAILVGLLLLTTRFAKAQTASSPQILITWSAVDSYAPPSYSGKILPNQNSPIVASLEILVGGTPADLSNQTIYWYLNGNLLGGGDGVQRMAFVDPDDEAPDNLTLEVELPDYPSGLLAQEINIPIVQPIAVIDAPYPQSEFSENPLVVQALPYFFSASSTSPLSFAWSVNGQTVSDAENPQELQISLPQSTPVGFAVGITLTVSGPSRCRARL